MFGIGFTEIILIAVLAVVVLGPDKLPQLGKTLARVLSEFNKIKRDFRMTISDIEKVGEEAASDIRSEVDEAGLGLGSGKEENAPEEAGLVAEDIDEVPETFEPEVFEPGTEPEAAPEAAQRPRPRRRRRTPRKAATSDISKGTKTPTGEDEPPLVSDLTSGDLKKIDAVAKTEAPTGALPTPEGTRQAAGFLGAKPAAAARPRQRRKPAANRATAASRATASGRTKAATGQVKATKTKSTSRARSSKAKAAETGTEKKTADASRSGRKPRSKKPENIIEPGSKVVGDEPQAAFDAEAKKNAVKAGAKNKPRPETVINKETKPKALPEPAPETSSSKKGEA